MKKQRNSKKTTIAFALTTLLLSGAAAIAGEGAEIGQNPEPDRPTYRTGIGPAQRQAASLRTATSATPKMNGAELDLSQPASGNRNAGANPNRRATNVRDLFGSPLTCRVFNGTIGQFYEIELICD